MPQTAMKLVGAWRILLFDGFESHLSWPVIEYCLQEKVVPVCLPAHTFHLLQPLDVGIFGPVQHAYAKQVAQLARDGKTHISKLDFIDLLAEARSRAFTPSNIAGAWRGAGVEPYDPSAVMKKLPGASLGSPTSASANPTPLTTPKTTRHVDRLIDALLKKDRSPGTLRGLTKLTKGFKMSLSNNALLLDRNNELLSLNAHHPMRKRRLMTMRGEFLTPIRAADLQRIADKREQKELVV